MPLHGKEKGEEVEKRRNFAHDRACTRDYVAAQPAREMPRRLSVIHTGVHRLTGGSNQGRFSPNTFRMQSLQKTSSGCTKRRRRSIRTPESYRNAPTTGGEGWVLPMSPAECGTSRWAVFGSKRGGLCREEVPSLTVRHGNKETTQSTHKPTKAMAQQGHRSSRPPARFCTGRNVVFWPAHQPRAVPIIAPAYLGGLGEAEGDHAGIRDCPSVVPDGTCAGGRVEGAHHAETVLLCLWAETGIDERDRPRGPNEMIRCIIALGDTVGRERAGGYHTLK